MFRRIRFADTLVVEPQGQDGLNRNPQPEADAKIAVGPIVVNASDISVEKRDRNDPVFKKPSRRFAIKSFFGVFRKDGYTLVDE